MQHLSPSPRFGLGDEEGGVWGAVGTEFAKVSKEEHLGMGKGIGVPAAVQVLRAEQADKAPPLLGQDLSDALESRESFWRGRAR